MIDAKRIEEMKRLSAEATEGPWEFRTDFYGCEEFYSHNDDEVITAGCGQNVGYVKVSNENAHFIAESRQFVPDIIAAYEFQLERLGAHDTVIKGLSEMVERRDAEIAELRKALEFYADREHYGIYTDASNNCPTTDVLMDDGHIAREALAWRNTTRK